MAAAGARAVPPTAPAGPSCAAACEAGRGAAPLLGGVALRSAAAAALTGDCFTPPLAAALGDSVAAASAVGAPDAAAAPSAAGCALLVIASTVSVSCWPGAMPEKVWLGAGATLSG